MIAGLPRSVRLGLVLMLSLFCLGALAFAQEDVQTPPLVIDPGTDPIDEQTPADVLQPVYDFIDLCAAAADADKDLLKTAFESAVTGGVLTVDQALGMLGVVGWDTLVDPEIVASALGILGSVLDDLLAGVLTDDPIAVLTLLWNESLTPAGTLNAIGKAGASDAVLAEVSSLVAGGVPPGILVRLTKEALRLGLTEEEILARIEQLGGFENPEEVSWGSLANEISGKGNSKHQEEEAEANANTEGNEDPEEERNSNSNGNGNGNGKKDDNPGKGKDKDKKK